MDRDWPYLIALMIVAVIWNLIGYDNGKKAGAILHAKGEIICRDIEFTGKWECKEVEK